MKLLIIGHAQHGKDAVCEILQRDYELTFETSSLVACRHFLWEEGCEEGVDYPSPEALYENRGKHRKWMHDKIREFNQGDLTRLARVIMNDHDIYCGLRNRDELLACKEADVFDAIIWVDASARKPPEPASSISVVEDDAEYVIDNNGTLDDLDNEVWKLMLELGIPRKAA